MCKNNDHLWSKKRTAIHFPMFKSTQSIFFHFIISFSCFGSTMKCSLCHRYQTDEYVNSVNIYAKKSTFRFIYHCKCLLFFGLIWTFAQNHHHHQQWQHQNRTVAVAIFAINIYLNHSFVDMFSFRLLTINIILALALPVVRLWSSSFFFII